jgi:aryl-alcohol dehydrogenase-like predicted oxidoreductase
LRNLAFRRSAGASRQRLGAVAVAWALRNLAVDGAIVGFRGPEQAEPVLVAADLELADEEVASLEGRGSL